MSARLLPWCGGTLSLRRVVLDGSLDEAPAIIDQCRRLGIAARSDPGVLVGPGDLWVGCGPPGGWGEVAGLCGWARSCEAGIVLARLEALR